LLPNVKSAHHLPSSQVRALNASPGAADVRPATQPTARLVAIGTPPARVDVAAVRAGVLETPGGEGLGPFLKTCMALDTSPLAQSAPEAEDRRHEELVRFLVGTALLAGVVASVALAILQWSVPQAFDDLVSGNQLGRKARGVMLGVTLGTAGATLLGLFVYRFARPAFAPARISRWGKLACPLLVAVFIPSLFARQPFKGRELDYLILLGAAGLLLEQLLRIAFVEFGPLPSFRLSDTARGRLIGRVLSRLPFAFVVAGVLYYAILIGHYTLATHV